jgi:hypothetical protein
VLPTGLLAGKSVTAKSPSPSLSPSTPFSALFFIVRCAAAATAASSVVGQSCGLLCTPTKGALEEPAREDGCVRE